jgi:hypothetical protein
MIHIGERPHVGQTEVCLFTDCSLTRRADDEVALYVVERAELLQESDSVDGTRRARNSDD